MINKIFNIYLPHNKRIIMYTFLSIIAAFFSLFVLSDMAEDPNCAPIYFSLPLIILVMSFRQMFSAAFLFLEGDAYDYDKTFNRSPKYGVSSINNNHKYDVDTYDFDNQYRYDKRKRVKYQSLEEKIIAKNCKKNFQIKIEK